MAVDTVGRGRPVWSLLLANANQNSRIARKGGLRREHKGVTTNKGISVKNNNFKPAFRVAAQRQKSFSVAISSREKRTFFILIAFHSLL